MIEIHDLTFTYPGADHPALDQINLTIEEGQFCLFIGSSGAGKSTLLRCVNGLVPHFSGGDLSGTIRVNGLDPVRLSPREMSNTVGFVFQDPEAQFILDRVEDEVAFSLENRAVAEDQMDIQVEEALRLVDIIQLRSRRLETLSGGERQRVAIAAALVLRPNILVLDEPTSQLDPQSADEVLQALVNLNKQHGLTILLSEHRLERVLPYTGQIVFLSSESSGVLSGPPRQVLSKVNLVPPLIALGKHFGWEPLPFTVQEAQKFVHASPPEPPEDVKAIGVEAYRQIGKADIPFIHALGVKVSYDSQQVLKGVDLDLYPGEITVLMGSNGAGKTTLLRSLIGLVPLQSGTVQVDGKEITGRSVADICQQVGYLPQDPNALLFADTVKEELHITLRNHHLDNSRIEIQPDQLLERLGLGAKADQYPRDLSTGERQRAAMGAIMVTHPGALLLDEPTRGLDYTAKLTLLDLLTTWREDGMAILLVTHDVELAAQAADRVVLLENGQVAVDDSPRKVFSKSSIFKPQVLKVFPGRDWLTVNDVTGATNASQH
jgi:energy-coupling factor transport system ATP-binding protein